jgi:hypothetical protein
MLPKELLLVRKRKGKIKPLYLKDTVLAEELISIFKRCQGEKYKRLLLELNEMEDSNFKVVRGLSTLLERRCRFTPCSKLPGREVRSFLFERGFVTSLQEREKLLLEASKHFHISKEEVEDAFFSDLEEEQILSEFHPIDALDLIRSYNLSITQTLLFHSLELDFFVKEDYKQIFRKIKHLGLMYEINEEVKVTGPASLFKKNKRYGTSLAKLLPLIIKTKDWKIHAKIEMDARVFDFNLSSNDKILFPSHPVVSIPHFDSEVEKSFYNEFVSLNIGWRIEREPALVKAGKRVIIPDFGFYKNGLVHYLEIVGFWTPEYLKKKISKLKEAEAPITVVVNENLNCKKGDFEGEVLFYTHKIPLMPILKILKEKEERQIEKEIEGIGEIKISEDQVSIFEMATRLKVSPESLKKINIPNYKIIGEKIVSLDFLKKIEKEIGKEQDYGKVEEILERNNLSSLALEFMGYKTIWEGLHPIKVIKL